jgi:hypothetical protein
LGLVPSRPAEPQKEAAALTFVAWLPFVVASLVEGGLAGAFAPRSLDLSMHARFLVAIPLSHVGTAILGHICKDSLRRLVDEGMGPALPLGAMAAKLGRWQESRRWAVLLWVVSFLFGQALFWGVVSTPAAEEGAGAAGPRWIWATWVALPIFYLVVLRALTLWLCWCWALFRGGRLPLRLSAAHPDYAGGLEFMVLPSMVLCVVVVGLSAVLASAWGTEIAFEGTTLTKYVKVLIAWVIVVLLVTLGPLVSLSPSLLRARVQGLRGFGGLASSYTRQFEDRWIRSVPDLPLLGAQDIQSLADLGGSFQVVRGMRMFPFQGRHALIVLLAAVAPSFPLVFTQVPLREILKRLFDAMTR